jgi:hypothetical protein
MFTLLLTGGIGYGFCRINPTLCYKQHVHKKRKSYFGLNQKKLAFDFPRIYLMYENLLNFVIKIKQGNIDSNAMPMSFLLDKAALR